MPSKWTGKGSATRLFKDIEKHVLTYTAEHQNEMNSTWFHRWCKLTQKYSILDQDRDFQFIAFILIENPDATVHECFTYLRDLIPELNKSINITNINKYGNIIYTYDPHAYTTDITSKPSIAIPEITSENPFNILQDESSSHTTDEELNDQPSLPTSPKKPDPQTTMSPKKQTTMSQYLDTSPASIQNVRKTYQKVSEKLNTIEENLPKPSDKNTQTFIKDISITYEHMRTSFDTTCQDIKMKCVQDLTKFESELQHNFKNECTNVVLQSRAELKTVQTEFKNILDTYKNNISSLQQQVDELKTLLLVATNTQQTNQQRTSPTIKTQSSTTNTHIKYEPSSTPIDTHKNQPPFFYHDNKLRFQHEGSDFTLLDRDFSKNSPQIDPPINEEDVLTVYT